MKKELFDVIVNKGLSYEQYTKLTTEQIEDSQKKVLSEAEKGLLGYTVLNQHRSKRLDKTYSVSDSLNNTLLKVTVPQVWMVITENWCGDSAQSLPVLAKIASVNPLIQLKIVLRDENPEIMDKYLTNGTRSIPVMVAFSNDGDELFKWGPRPEGAVKVIQQAKAEGLEKEKMYERLHAWYAKDKGKEIESEFGILLEPFTVDKSHNKLNP
ncbi:MAG: thioredoxin family protein [Bacteroidota bacterium]|nr:thioredoxin family protein [Bacteroidota bacterium]